MVDDIRGKASASQPNIYSAEISVSSPEGKITKISTSGIAKYHGYDIDAAARFSTTPDGKYLAAVFAEGTVAVWDVANKKLLHQFGSRLIEPMSIQISADGRRVSVGGKMKELGEELSLAVWELPK